MTEKEYKSFEQWSQNMHRAFERTLENAKNHYTAQVNTLHLFENFVASIYRAQQSPEEQRSEFIRENRE